MGKNNSKRKPRTEFSKMASIIAKLENRLRAERDAWKIKKLEKKENK